MRSIPVLFVALTIASGSSPARRSIRPQITGLYSNMAFTPSGDLGGVQLFVTRADTSFYVQFQMAEGDTDVPILMSLQVKDSTISFAFPTDTKHSTGLRNFRGTISRAGISGKFANGYAVNLPRLECSRR